MLNPAPVDPSDAPSLTDAQADAFYRAAALGLAWLDAREASPRRFGPAADASWRNYAGTPADLSDLDRLELLLRDAASLCPDAFGANAIFAIPGLTDDEPFGQWSHTPAPGIARDTFRTPPSPGRDSRAFLTDVARVLSLPLGSVAPLPPIGPTTRVLVVGPAALVAVAAHFADHRDLALHEQVFVVTDASSTRHLAGLAGLTLGELHGPRCLSPRLDPSALAAQGVTTLDVLAVSDDATTDERAAAEVWLAARRR